MVDLETTQAAPFFALVLRSRVGGWLHDAGNLEALNRNEAKPEHKSRTVTTSTAKVQSTNPQPNNARQTDFNLQW